MIAVVLKTDSDCDCYPVALARDLADGKEVAKKLAEEQAALGEDCYVVENTVTVPGFEVLREDDETEACFDVYEMELPSWLKVV